MAARWFSAALPPFGTVLPHLYALLTVSLVLGLSSRHVRETFVAGPLSAPLIPLPGLSRVINSLLTCAYWRDGLVVSALDQWPRGRGFESVGCGLSCSNRGSDRPVALCTVDLGLLNPPSSRGR